MTVSGPPDAYFPPWDLTMRQGEHGEALVARYLTTAEVKNDVRALDTGRVFIETEQRHNGAWQPGGITATQADAWAHVIGNVAIISPVTDVRAVIAVGRRIECEDSDHPTRGVVMSISRFVDLLVEQQQP